MEASRQVTRGPEDVILRDGTTLRLRPTTTADQAALVAFFQALSPESRYLRFHGTCGIDAATVAPFLDTDWSERGSLVGELVGADGRSEVVAVGTYVRLREPSAAEVGFAVADRLQGRGIGMRLLERLALHASESGIEEIVAEILSENSSMLHVARDAGFEVRRRLAQGVVELRLRVEPTAESFRSRNEARDHVAVAASLRAFFAPRSLAVIGASERRGTIGGELFRNILAAEFKGVAYPINRKAKPVDGTRAYESIAQIPEQVDLAVICLPAEHVVEAAESALASGVRALCVVSAGFAETGADGAERQAALLALVRAHGGRLIGPNCLGIAVAEPQLNATFARRALPPGRIAFSSQSGALGIALLEQASARGLGLSAFVSIGNKADVSSNDLLEYWEEDAGTDLVLLYLESFGNPRKFARIARRVARTKPILAMRSGTSRAGARAASSHTAALASSDAAVEALFRQAGVLRATTLEELLDAAELLSTQPLPRGDRVAVVTNAGGLGILCADACEASGLTLPALTDATRAALAEVVPREASLENPVDLLGSAAAATYEAALPAALADPGIDAVIALFVPPVVADPKDVVAAIGRAAAAAEKPLLSVVMSAEGTPRGGIAYPESAARALGLAARRAAWLRRPAGIVPDLAGIDATAARSIIGGALRDASELWLGPADVRALLGAYGVSLVDERVAATPSEAAAAAAELGFPVVIKTAAPGVHKTETGGVDLDVRSGDEVQAAAERIGGPVTVQPLLRGGVELLAGVIQDPVFGPLVAFGPGGVLAELIGDASFALAPLTDVDVDELLSAGKAARLLDGWRGAPPADRAALADLLHRLARLADDMPMVAELDLNPILAFAEGCVAVDARVRLRRPEPVETAKTW